MTEETKIIMADDLSKHPIGGRQMTKQADRENTDINAIIRRYRATGELPPSAQDFGGIYGDFTKVTDYHTAASMIREAELAFSELPAKIREMAGNDPAKFVEMTSTEEGLKQLGFLPHEDQAKPPEPKAPEPKATEAGEGKKTPPEVEDGGVTRDS